MVEGARAELELLADLTLAEFLRHLARFGGTVLEEDGLVLFGGAHPQPNPYRNGALRLDARLDADAVLDRAARFFAARRSGYVVWVREHGDDDLGAALRRAGRSELERLPEMVLERLGPAPPLPDGIELRRVTDEAGRRDYLRVVADAWGMETLPLEAAARMFFDPDSVAASNIAAVLAYAGDVPLSGTMTMVTHRAALGTQGGTVRSARRRGLAQSTLWEALKLSFEKLGAQRSVCQTSQLGQQAWMDLGYVPFTGYKRYLVPAGAATPSKRRASASATKPT